MFTGIVEEIGTIAEIRKGRSSAVLTVCGKIVLEDLKAGDSVAVNGVCLTATAVSARSFTADVMHETFDRSTLSGLKRGAHVNLERAMPANGRFGGHIVAGHVDGVGQITQIRRDDTAVRYTVRAAPSVLRYVVEKGSVAVDGISLTVTGVTGTSFSVSVIPHTARETVLAERRMGDAVNLETDIVGKYVETLVCPPVSQRPAALTKDLLSQYGF